MSTNDREKYHDQAEEEEEEVGEYGERAGSRRATREMEAEPQEQELSLRPVRRWSTLELQYAGRRRDESTVDAMRTESEMRTAPHQPSMTTANRGGGRHPRGRSPQQRST